MLNRCFEYYSIIPLFLVKIIGDVLKKNKKRFESSENHVKLIKKNRKDQS